LAEHSHSAQSHGDDHHGIGHVLPLWMLFATLGGLLALTVLTVAVYIYPIFDPETHAGLNLLVALLIAAVKATLVCLFFMHLLWDKRLNSIVFVSSILFFLLFVGFCLMDRGQYEREIRWDQSDSLRDF
jgi:cytochrome c oxidase subunit IV